jgi:hypothetical protein
MTDLPELPESGLEFLKSLGLEVRAFTVGDDGIEEIPLTDEAKPNELAVGQRVGVVGSDPKEYGHIIDICDCPMAMILRTRCVEVQLHESCGGADIPLHYKEYDLEKLD